MKELLAKLFTTSVILTMITYVGAMICEDIYETPDWIDNLLHILAIIFFILIMVLGITLVWYLD